MITQDSDPELWNDLYASYLSEGKPRDVTKRRHLYRSHKLIDGSIGFTLVETLDYLDSRSLKPSKPASYNKLKDSEKD